MRPNNSGKRLSQKSLTPIFSLIVFCFLMLTMIIVGTVCLILAQYGILKPISTFPEYRKFVISIGIFSVLLGMIITVFVSRLILKPVNDIVDAMRKLASGNYHIRVNPGKFASKFEELNDIFDGFNDLAAELEQTEMLRSDFVNNFSHEFKTPIVSISGFAKLLQRDDLTEGQRAEYTDIIAEESNRLSAMATNVLNLTKVENQNVVTEISRFNVSEQIRNCLLLLESKWESKDLNLDIDFDEYYIEANEELLKQVWINLIDNAIKFSDRGGVLGIKITETEYSVFISVSDRGPDIPDSARDRIFNKFYQADESHAGEGTGVGLAVVKRIVELHHGEVYVSSGGGTTVFTVSLRKKQGEI